jgi:tetratricopeptide (TPR) repeat protein
VRELNPAVPPRIAKLLERCLSHDPKARPAGAAALLAELRRHRRSLLRPMLMASGAALLLLGSVLATAASVKPTPISAAIHRSAAADHLIEAWQILQAGQASEAEERLREADLRFEHAIDAHVRQAGVKNGPWQDYAARGRVKMLLGNFGEAYRNNFTEAQSLFLEADRLIRDLPADEQPPAARVARLWACLSYCYSCKGRHGEAVHLGEKALQAGFRSAALLNNVGYSWLQRRDCDKAKRYLTEALRRDPNLLPAQRNEILLALDRCLLKLQAGEDATVPQWVLDQLDHAIPRRIEQGSIEPANLYVKAANLLVRQGKSEHGKKYLSLACRLGMPSGELKKDPIILGNNELVRWLDSTESNKLRRASGASLLDCCLVDPIASALP